MKFRQKTAACLVLAFFTAAVGATGCSKKLTPKKLMDEMSQNMAEVTSFSSAVEMDIKLEEVLYSTEVSLDMTLENTTEPKAGHARGTANVEMRGVSLSSTLEIYQVIEDGEAITYSSIDNLWSRQTEQNSGTSGFSVDGNLFQNMQDSLDTFSIAEQPVEVDGRECWQMYGNVTGESLIGLLGEDMMNAYGLVDIPDQDAVAGLTFPIIVEVYKEEVLPARILIDMTDVMDSLYEEYGESMKVNDFTIRLQFNGYNQAAETIVPQEIRDAAGIQY